MDLVEREGEVSGFIKMCYFRADNPVYHGLIDGVGGLVGEDAGGEAGHHLDHADLMRCLQHVVVDVDVVSLGGTDTSAAHTHLNIKDGFRVL